MGSEDEDGFTEVDDFDESTEEETGASTGKQRVEARTAERFSRKRYSEMFPQPNEEDEDDDGETQSRPSHAAGRPCT